MKRKVWIIIVIIILIVLGILFFIKNSDKSEKTGNTKISKTVEGITEYILNMSSYEATIDIEIITNKNETKYKIEQKQIAPNIAKQTVLEPSNISGLTTTFDGTNLKIENSRINLTTIYENYQYLTENNLFLNYFIEDYKNEETSKAVEKDGMIIMETKCKDSNNKYQTYKKLYINQNTAVPVKLEVQDNNKNTMVYILYNEIKINSTKREDVLAFQMIENKQGI